MNADKTRIHLLHFLQKKLFHKISGKMLAHLFNLQHHKTFNVDSHIMQSISKQKINFRQKHDNIMYENRFHFFHSVLHIFW